MEAVNYKELVGESQYGINSSPLEIVESVCVKYDISKDKLLSQSNFEENIRAINELAEKLEKFLDEANNALREIGKAFLLNDIVYADKIVEKRKHMGKYAFPNVKDVEELWRMLCRNYGIVITKFRKPDGFEVFCSMIDEIDEKEESSRLVKRLKRKLKKRGTIYA